MENVLKTAEIDREEVEQVIASFPPSSEIDSVDIRLDDDWSGDPSIYISFRLRKDANADDAFLSRFLDYTSRLTRLIIDKGVSRFPYTTLKDAA